MICPNCGYPSVSDGDSFCANCGGIVSERDDNHCTGDHCHIPLPPESCYCPRCGAMSFHYLIGLISPRSYSRP